MDRWLGTKEVKEKTGRKDKNNQDIYRTKHVQVTFVKNQTTYLCSNCDNSWTETVKEEKN